MPTAIGAMKVVHLIVRPSTDCLLDQVTSQSDIHDELGQIGLQFHEFEVHDGSPLVDKTLDNIEVRNNLGFLIVGIRCVDGSTMLNPPASTTLSAGDVVIVLGHDDGLPQLASRFTSSSKMIHYRGATMQVVDK